MTPEQIIARTLRAEQDGESQANAILHSLATHGYRLVHNGSGTTHWDGCWQYHHACALALIEADH